MTTTSELKEVLFSHNKDSVKDLHLTRSFSYGNGNDGEVIGLVLSQDTDWNLQSGEKAWGRPESVWTEYLFTWNPLLAEIEAMEACQWLKDAGFPQYAQTYKEGAFPIDLQMAKRDHGFLDEDAMEALIRRLKLLNKCATNKQLLVATVVAANPANKQKQQQKLEQLQKMQQQCLKTNESDDDEDDDLCCSALSDSWTYKRNSGQWCRQESPPWQISDKKFQQRGQERNFQTMDSTSLELSHCDAELKTNTPIKTGSLAYSNMSSTMISGDMTNGKDSSIEVSGPFNSKNKNRTNFLEKPSNIQENGSREGIFTSAETVTVDSIFSSKPFSNCKTDAKDLDSHTINKARISAISETNEKESFIHQNTGAGREFSKRKVITALSNRTDSDFASSVVSAKSFQDALLASSSDKSDQDISKHTGELLARDFSNSLDELELLIQSEFLSVSESNGNDATDRNTAGRCALESSPSKQGNHVRSKSATVVTAVARKVPESLPPITGCKTSPMDAEPKIFPSFEQQDKALQSPSTDQPFQRNTPITGSGRIRLALMKKMELLSGKKRKNGVQLKAEDIGEPTVLESEKLREKLESLGCVDLTPSPSSSVEVEEKGMSFHFGFTTPTASQCNKILPKGPKPAHLGFSSVTSTPSLEKLDEVLETLRICEESIGKESTVSDRSTLERRDESLMEHDDNKTYFNRAFDNIYRSSKKYNETKRARMVSFNTPSTVTNSSIRESLRRSKENDQLQIEKGISISLSSSALSDVNKEKFKSNRSTASDHDLSNSTSGNSNGRLKISDLEGVANVSARQTDLPNSSCNNSSHAYAADFPKSQTMSSLQGKHSFITPYSQPVYECYCANPTAELDSILDDLYRNIDSLNLIRSKSLEPEGSEANRELCGDTCYTGGSLKKTKLIGTKLVDASSSITSDFRVDSRKTRFEGSLRKPNIFNLQCSKFVNNHASASSNSDSLNSSDCRSASLNQNAVTVSSSNTSVIDGSVTSAKAHTDKTVGYHINKSIDQIGLLISPADDENGKSSAYSTISKDSLKFSMSSKIRAGDEERDSLTEKSGGTTSHDEDSQEGLESPVWDFPQQLTPDAGETRDNWTYADDHNLSERRDSGIGSPPTKGRRHQRRARIRWHSFACSHRVSVSSQSRQISSLSAGQLVVLKKLSLLKLTAALEKYSNIQLFSKNWLLRQQTKKSSRSLDTATQSKRVFGLPLTVVQQRHGQPLPECILRAMRHLSRTAQSCEGIFRKSGVKSRVQGLRNSVEASPDLMNFSDHSPYDVADLLKLYFRELPDCLLTNKLSSAFIAIYQSNIPDDVRIDLLTAGVLLMPDEHRESLACLLLFLNDMATHSQNNQMNASNLAICFAPAIFNLYALKGSREGMASIHSRKGRNRSLSPGSGGSLKGRRSEGLPGEKDVAEQKAAHLCLTSLITHAKSVFMESRDKFKGWVLATSSVLTDPNADVELKYKKVGDGHPLRLWKCQVEVSAAPLQVLNRVLRERHLWDPDYMRWRIVATLDSHTEVFQYSVGTMVPHPPRDFCELRSWRTDLPGGTCVLVSTSVEHTDARLGEDAVRGVVLASRYLIEPCAPTPGSSVQRSRLTHISRIDLRGHSLEWYNSIYSHLCANQALAIRDSFVTNRTLANNGPETVV